MIEMVFDGENIQKILESGIPITVAYSQHTEKFKDLIIFPGGTREDWQSTEKEETHPVVYVALGSHANYFQVNEFGIETPDIWKAGMLYAIPKAKNMDVTSRGRKLLPNDYQIVLISDDTPWLKFAGIWGEWTGDNSVNNGPRSPTLQEPWQYPLDWLNKRPVDSEYWSKR